MNKDMSDFTQGSILKKLCWFMLPVLGALVLQAAYGAVDLLVVGRFGSTSGLSAVSTGSQVLNLVTFVVTQLAMGVTVLIARYLGEKKPEKIPAVLGGATIVQLSCHGLLIPATLVIPVDPIHQQFGSQSLQMFLFPCRRCPSTIASKVRHSTRIPAPISFSS